MALLVNKKPYSLEWFHPDMSGKMCEVIHKSTIDPKDILFLIPDEMPLDEKVIECFKAKGVRFKENYELTKAIEFHDYKSKKDLLLHVYLPIAQKKNDP